MSYKPIIGITLGDPSGIGSEIIVKALTDPSIYEQARPIVIGDANVLEKAINLLHVHMKIRIIDDMTRITTNINEINCYDLNRVSNDLQFGQISAEAGNAAYEYLKAAVQLASDNKIDAICTAPLNKKALHLGGHLYPGHTEILAELTNTIDYSMMLVSPKLKVIHVTTHVGLLDAIEMIEPSRVYKVIHLAHDTLIKSGIHQPKIAVCGINPHAGENGLFGYGEEEKKIKPAIDKALTDGINIQGPFPADTLFYRAVKGDFDIVIAMYHDQGHGPIKVLGLDQGINITVGLPIIRTSVDHGTAFDIAGKGLADESSLIEAIKYAIDLSKLRNTS